MKTLAQVVSAALVFGANVNGQFLSSSSSSFSFSSGTDGKWHTEMHTVKEEDTLRNGQVVHHLQKSVDCIDGRCGEEAIESGRIERRPEALFFGGIPTSPESRMPRIFDRLFNSHFQGIRGSTPVQQPRFQELRQGIMPALPPDLLNDLRRGIMPVQQPQLQMPQPVVIVEEILPMKTWPDAKHRTQGDTKDMVGAVGNTPLSNVVQALPPLDERLLLLWFTVTLSALSIVCILRRFKSQAREFVGKAEPLAPQEETVAAPLAPVVPKSVVEVSTESTEGVSAHVEPEFQFKPSVGTWLAHRIH